MGIGVVIGGGGDWGGGDWGLGTGDWGGRLGTGD